MPERRSRTELVAVVEEAVRARPELADRAGDGNQSAEGRLVAIVADAAGADPSEVRPVLRTALRERRARAGLVNEEDSEEQ